MKRLLASAFGLARVFRTVRRSIREAREGKAAARLLRGIKPTEALVLWDGRVMWVAMFGGRFVFEVGGEEKREICWKMGWVENGKPAMWRLEIGDIASWG